MATKLYLVILYLKTKIKPKTTAYDSQKKMEFINAPYRKFISITNLKRKILMIPAV